MYFRSLQVLRGLAAVAVVLYHTHAYMKTIGGNPDTFFRFFDEHFSRGALFFFSLSGFLMAYLIDSGSDRFLARRLVRIYPTYWAAAMGVILVKHAAFDAVNSPGFVRALTLLPWGPPDGRVAYPLFVEWTLIYEVFFYLVCAAFAWGGMRRAFPAFLGLWAVALVVARLGFGAPTLMTPTRSQIPFSLHNLLFIAGGLTYHVFKRVERPTAWIQSACAATAVAALVGAEYCPRATGQFALWSTAFSAAILLGALRDRARGGPRRGSILESLGDRSYGLYLIHVPVITIVLVMAHQVYHFRCDARLGIVATASALLAGWYFGRADLRLHDLVKGKVLGRGAGGAGRSAVPAPMGIRADRPAAVGR